MQEKTALFKILIALTVLVFAGIAYQHFVRSSALSYDGAPYVHVYGREACGYTRSMVRYLESQGIPFKNYSVDNRRDGDRLRTNMRAAGIHVRSYGLPVVDINGEIFIRPAPGLVRTNYLRE